MSTDRFPDLPGTSEEAFAKARRSSIQDARLLRRLGAWLAAHEFEAIAASQERRARARMAQMETATAEAW